MSKPPSYINFYIMTKKEALIKSLIWRFGISIPVSFLLNLLFLKEINTSVLLTTVGAIAGVVLYYLFDLLWFNFLGDAFGFDRVTEEDSAGSHDD